MVVGFEAGHEETLRHCCRARPWAWHAPPMRVVSFNIHHGTVGGDGPVDAGLLGEVCADFEADILTLQEVDQGTRRAGGVDLTAAVAHATGLTSVFGASRWYPGGWYGNAILVRGQIAAWSVVALPRLPAWKCWQERRTLLTASCAVDGIKVRVATTHLDTHQEVSAGQLDHALRLVAHASAPVVFTGDLNRFRPTVEPAAQAAGLTYVPHGPTNPIPDPHRTLDHCLVSPDFELTKVEVRATAVSDHAALIVDLDGPTGRSVPRASGAYPR